MLRKNLRTSKLISKYLYVITHGTDLTLVTITSFLVFGMGDFEWYIVFGICVGCSVILGIIEALVVNPWLKRRILREESTDEPAIKYERQLINKDDENTTGNSAEAIDGKTTTKNNSEGKNVV